MSLVKLLAGIVAASIALPSAGQSAPDARLRDQLRQTTLQLRQLEDENAGLKVRNDSLTQQLAQRPEKPAPPAPRVDGAELRALRSQLQEEKIRAAELQRKLDTVAPVLERWKQSYDQVGTLAKTRDSDARRLESQFQQSHAALDTCIADNGTLADIGMELISRYRDKGVWSTIQDKEPLTGVSKIQFEKVAQDYRNRITDATVPVGEEQKR